MWLKDGECLQTRGGSVRAVESFPNRLAFPLKDRIKNAVCPVPVETRLDSLELALALGAGSVTIALR